MKTCLFTFYNYEINNETIETKLSEITEISKEVKAELEHLRFNLPRKYVPLEKVIEYALPQLFGRGYDKIVVLDINDIPSLETIQNVINEINDNDPVIGENCMGFCKDLYYKEKR